MRVFSPDKIVVALIAAPMLIALLPAPAAAQSNTAQTARAAQAENGDAKRHCRKVRDTGTNLPRTYCLTAKEWKAEGVRIKEK